MAVSDYYTSAGGNIALFPEAMAPAAVNDGMRQVQADIRAAWNDHGWFPYGSGSGPSAITYVSGTQFRVTGDATTAYWPNRRMRAMGSITGTIYGHVVSRSFAAGVTTVVAQWDSGSLSSETLVISLGIPNLGNPVPSANTTAIAAGTDNGVFMTPGKVADVTLIANPGYIRYPGGWLLQCGSGQTNISGVVTISLPFGVTTFNAPVITGVNSSHTNIVITASTVNNFSVLSTDAAGTVKTTFFTWMSMGY